jgi:hypothetical protein
MRLRIAFIVSSHYDVRTSTTSPAAAGGNSVNSVNFFMQLEGIDHVTLGVRDIEGSVRCYIEVLGFERFHEAMLDGIPTFIGKGNTKYRRSSRS